MSREINTPKKSPKIKIIVALKYGEVFSAFLTVLLGIGHFVVRIRQNDVRRQSF